MKHPRLRPFYEMTELHDYIIFKDDKLRDYGEICKKGSTQRSKCRMCDRLCCDYCFIVILDLYNDFDYALCKDCFILREYRHLYNITKLMFREQVEDERFDIYILTLIVRFSCYFPCQNCNFVPTFNVQFDAKRVVGNIIGSDIDFEYLRKFNMEKTKCPTKIIRGNYHFHKCVNQY